MKEGYLGYNKQTQRYGFLVADLWQNGEGFHAGQSFEVKRNGCWEKMRMEYDKEKRWYLVSADGTELYELEHLRIRV